MSNERENRERLQGLLRELFQFDAADLDFGVYRVMNQRRDRIERFIEEDLLDTVEEGLESIADAEREGIDAELEAKADELEDDWDDDIIEPDGSLKEPYADYQQNDLVAYRELREKRENATVAEETEARIFSDLYRFFSRYYDDGDFHTKRRISATDSKYAVPYNGEETYFHWANRDQYYVKSGEHFTDYRFEAGEGGDSYTVGFRLEDADVPQDDVKGDSRYFVLGRGNPISADADEREVKIRFQYRRITDDEADEYVANYNDATGDDRSSFAHMTTEMLCDALEGEVLSAVENPEVERVLTASASDAEDAPTRLKTHLTRYVSENSMDYFVHKDLEGFLETELEFYLQNEVLDVDDLLAGGERDPPAVVRARTVRAIAERIITFLAQIEEFQKRLFEKKKFVVETNYMVTLDQVPDGLYDAILDNESQLDQWREVYNTPEWEADLAWRGEFDAAFLDNHPYAMVDTGLFDEDFKLDLLAAFSDIETATDGVLVNGENFQALNLLLEKYRNEVDCTYIDPPYNTGGREFLYKDNYQHSSWLSMMADRLRLGRATLSPDGAIFVNIDDNEQASLKYLMNFVFGESNFVSQISWEKRYTRSNNTDEFTSIIDYLTGYGKTDQFKECLFPRDEEANKRYSNPDGDDRGDWKAIPFTNPRPAEERPNLCYPITNPNTGETTIPSGNQKAWRRSQDEYEKLVEDDKIWWGQDGTSATPDFKRFLSEVRDGMTPTNFWEHEFAGHTDEATAELKSFFGYSTFDTPKPTKLIKRVIQVTARNMTQSTITDFFAGSGTTAQAVMEMNREEESDRDYLLTEFGDYFDTLIRPRIQKFAFSNEWAEGVPQNRDGQTHLVKYHRLESYEDALNNITLREPSGPQQHVAEGIEDYVEGYLLDFESRESAPLLPAGTFEKPFDHELRIEQDGTSREPTPVDLVETFHYLVGADVRRYHHETHQDRRYVVTECAVETDTGVESVLTAWRPTGDLDLDREAAWFDEAFESREYDRVYVNGESQIARAEPLEITFRERMEESPNVA